MYVTQSLPVDTISLRVQINILNKTKKNANEIQIYLSKKYTNNPVCWCLPVSESAVWTRERRLFDVWLNVIV